MNGNITSREPMVEDESWIIEKLNKRGDDISDVNPRDFLVVFNEETNDRLCFGRIEYVKDQTDGVEFVEINSLYIVEGENASFYRLLNDLVESVNRTDINQVFYNSERYQELAADVGFEHEESVPADIAERASGELLSVQVGDISIPETEDDDTTEKTIDDDELEKTKESLNIEKNAETKYSI